MCLGQRSTVLHVSEYFMVMETARSGAGAGNDNLPDAGSTADLSVMEFLQNIFF